MDIKNKIATIATIAILAFCNSTKLNAKEHLEKATAKFSKHDSYLANLSIQFSIGNSKPQEESATLSIYGDMFRLEMDNQIIFSDSESNYTYTPRSKELVIETISKTSPLYSPMSLFSLDLDLFEIKEIETILEKRIYTLQNKTKMDGIDTIKVTLINNNISEVNIIDNTDNEIRIKVLSVDFGAPITPDIFKFNKREYKDVEIIDFR